jgi:hypothetical protein
LRVLPRRGHLGAYLLLVILAGETLHSIPQRLRYCSRLPSEHDPKIVAAYVAAMPVLFGLLYLVCALPTWGPGLRNRFHFPRPSLRGMAILVMALAVLSGLDYAGFRLFFPTVRPPVPGWADFALEFAMCTGGGFFANLICGLDDKQAAEGRRAAEAHNALVEARARLIAAQIDPHAMFNALGGVVSLIDEDPEQAKVMVCATSAYLKKLLLVTQSPRIHLSQERALVMEYLAVEGFRMGNRLSVEWAWPPDHDEQLVPPILVQPLVENAIKHGIWPNRAGGTLRIGVAAEESNLVLTVENDGAPLRSDYREGAIGLANIRDRLSHAYGDTAHFDLSARGAWTVATITIPLQESPCAS